jgi:haloalkane dehalogenase
VTEGGETASIEIKEAGGLAYREAIPDSPSDADPVLLVHGFPQSSYMWRHLMPALAAAGRRAIAPDLMGYGDSPPDPPATWQRHIAALEQFTKALDLERLVLVNHDWGGMISLRWVFDHDVELSGLVVSNTGFFPDGAWEGVGIALRTEGQGEALMNSLSREGFAAMLGEMSSGFDERAINEYSKHLSSEEGRSGVLELYRSGDFPELEPYQDRLARLPVPTLVVWGERDDYAPVANAHRFGDVIPGAKVVVIEDAGHFVWEDDPERCAREVVSFLEQVGTDD